MDVVPFRAINWDINLFIDHPPSPNEKILIKKISRTPILGEDKVAFPGAVDDDISRVQIRILKNEDIVTDAVKIVEYLEYICRKTSGYIIFQMYSAA